MPGMWPAAVSSSAYWVGDPATWASIAAKSEATCGLSSSATAMAGSSGTTEWMSSPKEVR